MTAPCIEEGCDTPKALPRHRCAECFQNTLPMVEQVRIAEARRAENVDRYGERARVPKREWPEGRRWCAGCQSFRRLGLDVSQGASRCRPCASAAAHASRTKAVFGIDAAEYERILAVQGGRCAICQQKPNTKRLAVDHDHDTGAVRGLLCSRDNHDLLGAAHDSIEYLLAAVNYLAHPPATGRWVSPQEVALLDAVDPSSTPSLDGYRLVLLALPGGA